VAQDILQVIRADAPAGHYAVGTAREKLAALAFRSLPSAATESVAARHFRLAG